MVLDTKSMPIVTLYVLSNVSYMKRVMMLVLPEHEAQRSGGTQTPTQPQRDTMQMPS